MQLIAIAQAPYVVARASSGPTSSGLYRIVSGRLVLVRALAGPGVSGAVEPFRPRG